MNRFLPILPLLAALSATASAAPYVLPSPQPGALTPYDWQPVYAIEGLYSFAQNNNLPDTAGVRGSFNLYNSGTGTFRHQFNVNVAAAWGNDGIPLTPYLPTQTLPLPDYHADLDLFLLPVTLGYNLNIELLDSIMLYLGGKAGYAWSHSKLKVSGKTPANTDFSFSQSHDDGGFTFSAGAGIKVQCSDSIYVHAGYEFGRSFLDYNPAHKTFIYGSHTLFLGLSHVF